MKKARSKKKQKNGILKDIFDELSKPLLIKPLFPIYFILPITFLILVLFHYLFLVGQQYYPPKKVINGDPVNPECNILINSSYTFLNDSVLNVTYYAKTDNRIGFLNSYNLFRIIESGTAYMASSHFLDFGIGYYDNETTQFSLSFPIQQAGSTHFDIYCITSILNITHKDIIIKDDTNFTVFRERGKMERVCLREDKLLVFMRPYPMKWYYPYDGKRINTSNFAFPHFLRTFESKITLVNSSEIIFVNPQNVFLLIHDVLLNSLFTPFHNLTIVGDLPPFFDYLIHALIGTERIVIPSNELTCYNEASIEVHHKEPEQIPQEIFQKIADASSKALKHNVKRGVMIYRQPEMEKIFNETKEEKNFFFMDYYNEDVNLLAPFAVSAKAFVSEDCDFNIIGLLMPMDTVIYIHQPPTDAPLTYATKLLQQSGRKIVFVDEINEAFLNSIV